MTAVPFGRTPPPGARCRRCPALATPSGITCGEPAQSRRHPPQSARAPASGVAAGSADCGRPDTGSSMWRQRHRRSSGRRARSPAMNSKGGASEGPRGPVRRQAGWLRPLGHLLRSGAPGRASRPAVAHEGSRDRSEASRPPRWSRRHQWPPRCSCRRSPTPGLPKHIQRRHVEPGEALGRRPRKPCRRALCQRYWTWASPERPQPPGRGLRPLVQ